VAGRGWGGFELGIVGLNQHIGMKQMPEGENKDTMGI
jgi:hypothetical protein